LSFFDDSPAASRSKPTANSPQHETPPVFFGGGQRQTPGFLVFGFFVNYSLTALGAGNRRNLRDLLKQGIGHLDRETTRMFTPVRCLDSHRFRALKRRWTRHHQEEGSNLC